MQVVSRGNYPGPNLFGPVPCVRAVIDFGPLAERPIAPSGPVLADRLRHTVPPLMAGPWPGTSIAARDHLASAPAGTVPDLVAALALMLVRSAFGRVAFLAVRRTPQATMRQIVVETEEGDIGQAAVDQAIALVADALSLRDPASPPFDRRAAYARFQRVVERNRLHGLTALAVRVARARDIPALRQWPRGGVVQLGQGRRRVRLLGSTTDRTSSIAVDIVGNKAFTGSLLRANGIPVPAGLRVDSADAAVAAATAIGFPVVVKPTDGSKGRGVQLGLQDAAAVAAAFPRAAAIGPVMVEREIAGDDHRLLVIDGRLVAAARRLSARVVGDGRRTVRALIDRINADPRRGPEARSMLVTIAIDDEVQRTLAEQGKELRSVPADGEVVLLRRTANISTGGTMEDVTPRVHPECRRIAERAAVLAGLDICGVDLITTDITRSPYETGAGICELNRMPGLRPHMGDPRSPDVAQAIVDSLIPPGSDGRIPVAAITGTNGKTTTTLMVARIMRAAGAVAGMATTDGVWVDDEQIGRGDRAGLAGAHMVLRDPRVEVAVLEVARGGIIRDGLGFDRCNVGAVLNVGDDHVGISGVDDAGAMAEVKRLVVAHARDLAVLNAEDPRCVAMAARLPAAAIAWVSPDPRRLPVAANGSQRALGVTVAGEGDRARIVVRVDGVEIPIVPLAAIPAIEGGRVRFNLENALFATAITWGLGAPAQAIARGLAGRDRSFAATLGRLASYDALPFRVIVDFGHNPGAMQALADYVRPLPVAGRRICLVNAPDNRVDAHYPAMTRPLAHAFDHFVCSGSDEGKARTVEEVAGRLASGLIAAGVAPGRIDTVPDETQAVAATLALARPGDLVLLLVGEPEQAWRQVEAFRT